MQSVYWLKYRGEVLGEFSWESLQAEVERGRVTPLHQISSDGQTWYYVHQLPEILQGGAPVLLPAAPAAAPEALLAEPVPSGWYAVVRNERFGPYEDEEIGGHIVEGRLRAQDLVWKDDFDRWMRLDSVFPRHVEAAVARGTAGPRRVPPEEREWCLLALAGALLSFIWVFGLGSIAGLFLSMMALIEIRGSRGKQKGLAFALAGTFLGLLGATLTVVIFVLNR